ncbi:MAG: hypothetical protein ABI120_20955 [Gemmatimonadaceae bacterium]
MSPTTPVLRHRSWGYLGRIAVGVAINLVAAVTVRLANAQTRPASPPDSIPDAGDTVIVDANKVHQTLRKRIQQFEDVWRKEWQANWDMLTRTQQAQSEKVEFQPLVRRSLNMGCYWRTPNSDGIDTLSDFKLHVVVSKPDFGALCPAWFPPLLSPFPDEEQSIDFALPYAKRAAMRGQRAVLIRELDKAHDKSPGDVWVTQQLVRFLYDQRDAARALQVAQSCRGDLRTCAALRGLVWQQQGKIVAAEAEFRIVDSVQLVAVPGKNSICIDPQIILLFNTSERARIKDASCDAQKSFAENLWWLADPLWGVRGNERYVTHGTRRIQVALRSLNNRDERYVWQKNAGGAALQETVVRYGWPSYTNWLGPFNEVDFANKIDGYRPPPPMRGPISSRAVQLRTRPLGAGGGIRPMRLVVYPFTTKEYLTDRTAFVPAFTSVQDPFTLNAKSYDLINTDLSYPDAWWPKEFMKTPITLALLDSGQSSQWRRDSSIVYQLTIDDPLRALDSTATGSSLVMLMGGSSPRSTRELANSPIAPGYTVRLRTELTGKPLVLSAEILPRSPQEQAMRLRFGLRPPPTLRDMKSGELALSDPVFLRLPNRTMTPPVDEVSVLRYMAGGLSFPKSEILALYWESYGFAPGDTVQIELRIRRDDNVSVARRVGSMVGVASALRDSVSIRWTEPDGRHTAVPISGLIPAVGRTVALDVNALAPGTYVAIIEMRKGALAPVRSERRFNITER